MDFLAHPKGLPRLWSCLMSDYELLLHQYVIQQGWTFSHFAKCARDTQITLLYHASVAHGRKRDAVHERIGGLILNTVKDLWLHPGPLPKSVHEANKTNNGTTSMDMEEDDEDDSVTATLSAADKKARVATEEWKTKMRKRFEGGLDGEEARLKYQLGAFFLTYVMYDRQPYTGLLKVLIDPEDYEQFVPFHAKVLELDGDVADEYRFIFHKLRINYAFVITAFSDKYDITAVVRSFLNVKKDEMVELLKSDRRIIDALAHSGINVENQNQFGEYMKLKQKYLKRSGIKGGEENPENGRDKGISWATGGYLAICEGPRSSSTATSTLASTLESQQGIGEVATSATVIHEMGAKPVFTHSALLGNDTTSKMFMTEATKRLQRMQAKYQKDKEGPKPAKKTYTAGGIFSRAREDIDDGDEGGEEEGPKRTKGRAQTSNNLWNYIKGKGFTASGQNQIRGNDGNQAATSTAGPSRAKTGSAGGGPTSASATTPSRVPPARKAKSESKWRNEV